MAKASITFVDHSEGVLLTLNFDDDLPEDPADATEAQVQAMLVFQDIMQSAGELEEGDFSQNGDGFDEESADEAAAQDDLLG